MNVKRKKILQLVNDFGCLGSSVPVWALTSVSGAPLVAMCGLLMPWLSVWGSRGVQAASAVVVCILGCPMACKIFLDQGSNLSPLHWQVDALPLDHWETPKGRNYGFYFTLFLKLFFIEIMLLCNIVLVSTV